MYAKNRHEGKLLKNIMQNLSPKGELNLSTATDCNILLFSQNHFITTYSRELKSNHSCLVRCIHKQTIIKQIVVTVSSIYMTPTHLCFALHQAATLVAGAVMQIFMLYSVTFLHLATCAFILFFYILLIIKCSRWINSSEGYKMLKKKKHKFLEIWFSVVVVQFVTVRNIS